MGPIDLSIVCKPSYPIVFYIVNVYSFISFSPFSVFFFFLLLNTNLRFDYLAMARQGQVLYVQAMLKIACELQHTEGTKCKSQTQEITMMIVVSTTALLLHITKSSSTLVDLRIACKTDVGSLFRPGS
jgi:hypothetical protein